MVRIGDLWWGIRGGEAGGAAPVNGIGGEGRGNRRRDESDVRIWREIGTIDGDVGGRKITERKMGTTCKKNWHLPHIAYLLSKKYNSCSKKS
jgi:hypothetical protein